MSTEEVAKGERGGRAKDDDGKVDVEMQVPTGNAENDSVEGQVLNDDNSKSTGGDLDPRTDPFAPREGKRLDWSKVNMVLAGKKDEPDRKLLDNVFGEVPPKETTAIMGPSGAGKTSLLNILAGRLRSHDRITVTSDVRLDNYTVDPSNMSVRKLIAFVAQEDSLQVTATPREAIRFSAKLRLPRITTENQLDRLTERMIVELGLTDCADTLIGGELVQGISGGERKRTSVGVELVVKPIMVFLDEPTSGLDSFSAVQLCQVLKKVADAGASVLFTIHQPSSEIFHSFDHLILMNKGRVMYHGAVSNVPEYFGARGHACPPHYNPADWIMTVAQSVKIETLDEHGFFQQDEREAAEPSRFEEGATSPLEYLLGRRDSSKHDKLQGQYQLENQQPGKSTQISMLFARELRNLRRDTKTVGARFALTTFLSTMIGIIFFRVGDTSNSEQKNLQSHFGAVIMVLFMSIMGTALPTLLAFPSERPVFLREYSTNHYSVLSYFLSRLTTEILLTSVQVMEMTIITHSLIQFQMSFGMQFVVLLSLAMASTAMAVTIGCAVEDPKLALEFLPMLFVPQVLFAGFFVVPELIPVWLRWARFLCALTYGVRIAMVEEFHNCDPNDLAANEPCNNLLLNIDAHKDDTWWDWLVLIAIFAGFRLWALFLLQRKAVKFF